jgi:hypothetical protein
MLVYNPRYHRVIQIICQIIQIMYRLLGSNLHGDNVGGGGRRSDEGAVALGRRHELHLLEEPLRLVPLAGNRSGERRSQVSSQARGGGGKGVRKSFIGKREQDRERESDTERGGGRLRQTDERTDGQKRCERCEREGGVGREGGRDRDEALRLVPLAGK